MTAKFEWANVRWEPGNARPGNRCSYCGAPIPCDHVPLILWQLDTSDTARFCQACESLVFTDALLRRPCPTQKH